MPGLLQLGQVCTALAILYVVYLIIRAVTQRRTNGRNGDKPISYWKREFADVVREGVAYAVREELRDTLREVLEPSIENQRDILEKQNEILRELAILKERRGFPRS